MAKWVDAGENRVANILFKATAVDANLYLGIYTDTTEPPETANLPTQGSPITELATAFGYARANQVLARGTWTITADHADYAQLTLTASGGAWANCYGYFIATTSDNSGVLLCVEHFTGGPFNVPDGGSIKITPKITVA